MPAKKPPKPKTQKPRAAKAAAARRKAPARKPARKATPASPKARKAAARRRVARPRRLTKAMERAEHEHQDPRVYRGNAIVPGGVHEAAPENYGQFRGKATPRADRPGNWFRRAAKPPSK